MSEHNCTNCVNTFKGHYCNNCGQAITHRITTAHVIHDFFHIFTHADKGLLALIPKIILYPGITAKEYIEGKRKIYNPFQYLVIIIGISVFLLSHSPFYHNLIEKSQQSVSNLPPEVRVKMANFFVLIQKYTNIISLLTLPIFAFFSSLFFKSPKYNYAEHITLQVFGSAQLNTINSFIILVFIVTGTITSVSPFYSIGLMIVCFIITYKQFFNQSWVATIFKCILAFGLAYLVQVIIMGAVTAVYLIKSKH